MIRMALACIALCLLLPAQSPPDLKQQVEAHARKAQEYVRANQPELAAREYAAIVALAPDDADAQGNLGVLLFFKGDYAQAAPHLQAALKLRPSVPKLEALLGMAQRRIGQSAAARASLEHALPQVQDEKLRRTTGLELIELYYTAGDLDKAAAVVGALRRWLPSDPEVLYTANRLYSDLAGETMLRLTMLAPNSARMHQVVARELARQGNREAAISRYKQALQIDPQTPGLHFDLGELYYSSRGVEDRDLAAREFQAAADMNPFDERAACRLGEVELDRSNPAQAVPHYTRALELQPGDVDANSGMARALQLLGQPNKALPYLEQAAQLDPLDPSAHYRLASLYRSLGRTTDADREFAEFKRLKDLKQGLLDAYKEMHVQPAREGPDLPK